MESDATAEFAEAPAQTEETVFCTGCGFANPPGRGACIMCLNYLMDDSHGANCPSCGAPNPGHSRFCSGCGAVVDATAVGTPSRPELVERVLDAVGDVGIGADEGVGPGAFDDDEAFVGPAVDEYAEEPGVFEEVGAVAATEGAKPERVEVPEEAIPGPLMEPAEEIEPDEDFAPPPPPGVIAAEDEDDFAPPPPPGVIAAEEEEDFAPPPPPGVIEEAEADDFAPPPAPGVIAEPEDDFAPPPAPGVIAEPEDDFAPPPAPPGVVAEPAQEFAPPPPPPPGAVLEPLEEEPLPPAEPVDAEGKGEESETDFGDWALDFTETEEADEEDE